ncbi:MAG: hypothetical protein R3F61_00250 [Myxococcota bacterium]
MRPLLAALLFASTPAWAGGYARLDFQRASQVRVGVFAPVSRTVAIAPVARLSGREAELDVGVTADIGALYLAGWVGGGMRFSPAAVPYVSPGLSFALEVPPLPLYIESWTELRVLQPFGGTADELWKQDLLLITVRHQLSLGGQYEPTFTFPGGLQTSYIGPRANFGFRRGDAIGVFGGWDTQGNGFTGRVTVLLRF